MGDARTASEGTGARGTAAGEPRERLVRAFLHEARSPLNALAIYLDLLTTRVAGMPGPPGRPDAAPDRLVGRAQDQVRRLEELLSLFGDAAAPRREDGADLARTARAVGRFAAHEAVRLGCRLDVDAPGPAPVGVEPSRLSEALTELALRIVRAPEGTPIALRVQAIDGAAVLEAAPVPFSPDRADAGPHAAPLARAGARVELAGDRLRAVFDAPRGDAS